VSHPDAVVLVGASGFVGRNIVEALRGRIGRLVAVTGSGKPVDGCAETFRLAELGAIGPLPAQTVIVHVAARRYDAATFRADQPVILDDNVAMTNAVFAFAAARGIKELRFASSAAIYPSSFDVLDDERPFTWSDWPHDGEAAYAWSKRWGEIMAEHYRRNHGISTLSFRLSNPYGPFDTTDSACAHVATAFAIRALDPGDSFAIKGNPDARRDFVYAGDVADVFRDSLAVRGVTDAMNLGHGTAISVRDLAEAAIAASGQAKSVVVDGAPGGGVAVRQMRVEKLRRMFPDAAATTAKDGLVKTLAWYRDALGR
jgi:nucleoside-diphosphate-sugar epimerase